MNEELVTIVVPVYNVEKYLDRCLRSIVNQTYTNLEIILVDDCATDTSGAICDEWAKQDARIRVIHKPVNQGLGFARNTGIEAATGEYICFFDSDDYVALTLVEECYAAAKSNQADTVCFGNSVVVGGEVKSERNPNPPKDLYEGEEIRTQLIPRLVSYNAKTGENWNLSLGAWCEFYSMRLIREHQWRFVSEREIISEDYYSLMVLYQYVRRMVFIRKAFYHYCIHGASLSSTYRTDRFEKVKNMASCIERLGKEAGYEIEQENTVLFFGLTISAMKHIVASGEKFQKKIALLRRIINDEYLQNRIRMLDYSGDSARKKILYSTVKMKQVWVCYFLVWMWNQKGRA